MPTLRDRLWLWGHMPNVHLGRWGVHEASRITPAEAAFYLGTPNVFMVDFHRTLVPPYDQVALSLAPLPRVVWSMVGASGLTNDEHRKHVLDLLPSFPNIDGIVLDDFFNVHTPDGKPGALSLDELDRIRAAISTPTRHRDLWCVIYGHQLELPVREHLGRADKALFAVWRGEDLPKLDGYLASLRKLAPPSCELTLALYLWDYGMERPMPAELMRWQCEAALRHIKGGTITHICFVASCVCDLRLPAVEWTRQWIKDVGDMPVAGKDV